MGESAFHKAEALGSIMWDEQPSPLDISPGYIKTCISERNRS